MIEITDTIQFNSEEPLLSKQSPEFAQWYSENFHSKIVEPLHPIGYDQYGRPSAFINHYDGWKCTTEFIYIYNDGSNWACSDFRLTLEKEVNND